MMVKEEVRCDGNKEDDDNNNEHTITVMRANKTLKVMRLICLHKNSQFGDILS